MLVEREV